MIKRKKKVVFADNDTLSSFLWREAFQIFVDVFRHENMEILIPQQVIDEMENTDRTKRRLAEPILGEKRKGTLDIIDMEFLSDTYNEYEDLREKGIGKGEAAALSHAKTSSDIAAVASNNLRDVKEYVEKYGIELWTTARILTRAVELEIVTQKRASTLWKKMYENGLKLPCTTFEEFQENHDLHLF